MAFQGFWAACFWWRRQRAFQQAQLFGALKLSRAKNRVSKSNEMKKKVKNSPLREKHCGAKGLKKPDDNAQRSKERPKCYYVISTYFLCNWTSFYAFLGWLTDCAKLDHVQIAYNSVIGYVNDCFQMKENWKLSQGKDVIFWKPRPIPK